MKRRGFLAALAAAPIVGPAVAKQAADKAVAELAGVNLGGLGGVSGALGGLVPPPSYAPQHDLMRAASLLRSIAGLTAEQRRKARRNVWVQSLDPDLASYRSMSLSFRMEMQRDRNLQYRIENRRGWLERTLAGENPNDDIENLI